MLCARIEVIQPQIRNLIVYLLPLPDKILTTAVVKQDKTSRLDRNDRQTWSRLQRTLLIRKCSIKDCLLLLWACLKISCISRLCCVWNNVCVHVCKIGLCNELHAILMRISSVKPVLWLAVNLHHMLSNGAAVKTQSCSSLTSYATSRS